MKASRIVAAVTLAALLSVAAFGQAPTIIPPEGRLTLTSNTPVMTGDVTSATTIYYAPYLGNSMPSSNGTSFSNSTFNSQLTLTLNSTQQTAGNVYDIFTFFSSPNWFICVGPAWASTTSRGTGAGTTQLTQLEGLWVNAVALTTCHNGTTNGEFAADVALYLGSVYMTANGETSMVLKPSAASGGTANVMGLYNAYNRVRTTAYSRDSTSNWLYATASWRAADNSTSNEITFLDGLQQSPATGQLQLFGCDYGRYGNGIHRSECRFFNDDSRYSKFAFLGCQRDIRYSHDCHGNVLPFTRGA
jgi:hypothetical protein